MRNRRHQDRAIRAIRPPTLLAHRGQAEMSPRPQPVRPESGGCGQQAEPLFSRDRPCAKEGVSRGCRYRPGPMSRRERRWHRSGSVSNVPPASDQAASRRTGDDADIDARAAGSRARKCHPAAQLVLNWAAVHALGAGLARPDHVRFQWRRSPAPSRAQRRGPAPDGEHHQAERQGHHSELSSRRPSRAFRRRARKPGDFAEIGLLRASADQPHGWGSRSRWSTHRREHDAAHAISVAGRRARPGPGRAGAGCDDDSLWRRFARCCRRDDFCQHSPSV